MAGGLIETPRLCSAEKVSGMTKFLVGDGKDEDGTVKPALLKTTTRRTTTRASMGSAGPIPIGGVPFRPRPQHFVIKRKVVGPVTPPPSMFIDGPEGHCVAGGSALMSREYVILRSQLLILNQLKVNIGDSEPEMLAIIDKMKNATFAELFEQSVKQMKMVRELLNGDRSFDQKYLTTLLSILIAISRVGFVVSYSFNSAKGRKSASIPGVMDRAVGDSEESFDLREIQEVDAEDESFICRICEESVPLDLIDEHSALCIRKHENHFHFYRCTEKLKEVLAEVQQLPLLQTEWPGTREEVVEAIFPLVSFCALVNMAYKVNLTDVEAIDRLDDVNAKLASLCIPAYVKCSTTTANVFGLGRYFAQKKLAACREISKASKGLTKMGSMHVRIAVANVERRLADFKFIDKLSSGAFARVYLARRIITGDLFAIKVIKRSEMAFKNQLKAVGSERDIMKKLRSPYIVKFYYSFIEQHNMYIVMEYIPGGDICSLLDDVGTLQEDDVRVYTVQLVKALEFLRTNRIIHRDIKPNNTLVGEKGRLKLTDFGLSYFGSSGHTPESKAVGTPDYMAPEVITSQEHTFAVDYWSLGVMVFELLCGSAPFHGEDEASTFRKILCCRVPWDKLDEEEVSDQAKDFIGRLLVPDPEQRLGAKDISEIMRHPWFSEIDWDHVEDIPPVFEPDTKDLESYREFFHDKGSALMPNEEIDIIEDIEQSRQSGGDRRVRIDDPRGDISMFPKVGLGQLGQQNKEIGERIRTDRLKANNGLRITGSMINLKKPWTTPQAAPAPSPAPVELSLANLLQGG